MAYRLIADGVVLIHFGFILFVALGGLLSWRWPRLIVGHIAAVAWGAGIVAIGWDCPLTPIEKHFRRLGGEQGYSGGFVDRYIEGVIYQDDFTPWLRLLVAVLVGVGWAGLYLRRRRRTDDFRPVG
ncbi:MAG: DUF2784 domain-containing protein [Acidimicrobiales bacterium]